MKVVFLADSISKQKAGIHYYGKQLVSRILDTYPQHDYIAVSASKIEGIEIENVIVPIKDFIPFHYRLRQFFDIPNLVKSMQADVVIELAHLGPFRLDERIKRVTVIHDLSPITHRKFHSPSSYLAHKYLLPNIVKSASNIIVNSVATQKSMVDYYGDQFHDKITVCYPKFEVGDFEMESETLVKNYFLSIGTIEPRKNYNTILAAYDTYRKRGGNFKLVIVGGSGWDNKSFYENHNKHDYKNDIILTGHISRNMLLTYLAKTKALISASFFEGFGLPVYEAMLLGKPLILSNIEVYKEIASKAGLFFNPTDVGALSECMLKAQDNSHINSGGDLKMIEEYPFAIPVLVER